MKTFMADAANIERKWYVLDASGMALGRVASQAASVLRGKNKPQFTPHADASDYVIILNSDKAVLTGNKKDEVYRHHTMVSNGLKEVKMSKLMAEKSDEVMYRAVKGMLPKNSLGRGMLKKLRVYKGGEHEHQAQQPVELKLIVKSYK